MGEVLIHIGYPKTGSTFLQYYFRQHPDITTEETLFEKYKETGEISHGLNEKEVDGKYLVLSEEQLSVWRGNLNIVGARFCNYNIKAHQEKVALQLHALLPKAKILIITRGFISAFRSMYSQYIRVGGTYTPEKAIKEYKNVFAEFYDYNYLIRVYRNIFGKNQVIVLPYELMNENLREFLMQLEIKSSIPYFEISKEKINPSFKSNELFFLRQLSATVCKVISPLPKQLQESIYGSYVNFLHQRKMRTLGKMIFVPQYRFDFHDALWRTVSNKAEILKFEPDYQNYLEEYIF